MEAATQAEVEDKPEREVSSFTKSLFLGEIHEETGLPVAGARPGRAGADPGAQRGRPRHRVPDRPPRDRGEAVDRRRRDPRARRGRAVRPLRRRGVRRPGPLADRLRARLRDLRPDRRDAVDRPRRPPVDRLQGHPPVRHRRAEGALPPRPRRRPQARRVRAHRARGRLGRLQPQVAGRRPARRLVGAERREALHRQRLEGRGVHHLRPLRGRRQGPPHRADPREGDEGLRGRRALRHDGPARQRPAAPLLQRRQGPGRERARRARRGLQDRDAGAQQRPDRPRHRLGRGDQAPASTWRSTTSRSAASSASRSRTSSSSRTRSPGWSPTCSGSSRCAT